MPNWLYKNVEISNIEQFPENCIGFVYKVTNKTNGKFYIGKKILRNSLSKPLTKKEISEWSKPGRIPKKTKVTKESNWKDYYGSSKLVEADRKAHGDENFDREILSFCTSKKQMSYLEVYYQFKYDVLITDSYNENILGKFFRKDAAEAVPELTSLTN